MSGRVLVTGGSGLLGRALVARLVGAGRDVRALARSERAAVVVASLGAEPIPGDVLDQASLATAVEGCTSVFHVAGVNQVCARDPRPMLRTNIDGSTNVVRAVAETGIRRLVYTSSASAIGEARGEVGREDSPHRGSYLSEYERSKHMAERRVLRLSAELELETVVVNPSSVQGPGRASGSARLLLEVVNGRLPVLVDTTISLVDIDDCAEGHMRAEAHGRAGERYLLSGATLTTREALVALRRIWGRPGRVRFVPGWIASAGGATVGAANRLLRRDAPVCPEAVRTLLHGHRYDGSKATRELGLRYRSFDETLLRTLEWCAVRGLVPPSRATAPRP